MSLEYAHPPEIKARVTAIDRPEMMEQFAQDLRRKKMVAFDTETIGHDIRKESPVGRAQIISWSACFSKDETFYIKNYGDCEGMLRIFKPWLEEEDCPKTLHNAKYDMHSCANHGIKLRGVKSDTMVKAWLVDENELKKLETAVLTYFGETYPDYPSTFGYKPLTKAKARRVQKRITPGLIEIINPDSPTYQPYKLSKYGAKDAWLSFRMRTKLDTLLNDIEWRKGFSMLDYYNEIENEYLQVLWNMEREGTMLDVPFLNNLTKKWEDGLQALEADFIEGCIHAGAPQSFFKDFNIKSNKQLGKLFFDILGMESGRETKTGFAVDDSELERLAEEYDDLVAPLREWRELDKLIGTYSRPLPLLVDKNSRVHSSFNQCGTVTGRLSSSNPNQQNVPIRSELGKMIRQAFIAKKGHKIISADSSQVELRLMAHFAEDQRMIDGFREGADFHAYTAKQMYAHLRDVPVNEIKEKYEEERGRGKTLNFGINYGMGPNKLAKQWNVSLDEAKRVLQLHSEAFPGIPNFKRHTIMFARQHGYVRTLLRRYRNLPHINDSDMKVRSYAEREAVNSVIQGSSADLMKLAMLLISRCEKLKKLGYKMLIQVHDELVGECPEENVEKAKKLVCHYMADPYEYFGMKPLKVPTPANAGAGDNWAVAH